MTFLRRRERNTLGIGLVCVMMGTALAGPPGSGWLVQFGSSGNELWRSQWGTSAPDSAEGISSFRGGVVMGGGSAGDFDGNGNDGRFDAVLLSLDAFGRER